MSVLGFEDFEARWRRLGRWPMAGIDEAGRGPLAGPVSVALVVFPEMADGLPHALEGLDDSKKLKPAERARLLPLIETNAKLSLCVHISSRTIDSLGINPAIELGIDRLLRRAMQRIPDLRGLAVDGNYLLTKLRRDWPQIVIESVVRGDSRAASIAAASVVAKERRDRRMLRYSRYFPGYGLEKHKGYGTAFHRRQIGALGPSPLHRRSFRW
ncbi:MAG: ribonuclease HII [Leptospirales bacterium]|nr:ribonuclease HII [Leptospirales bacterium]